MILIFMVARSRGCEVSWLRGLAACYRETSRPRNRATSVRRFVCRKRLRILDANLAELLLVEADVVAQSLEELLGVQRSHDRPAVDLHVGTPRNHAAEVDHEFAGGVDDVGEVDVLPLGNVVVECDAN